jgi:UDP-3-O-[3-hydroxymyristoyl] glucosamine N-acyltransferase
VTWDGVVRLPGESLEALAHRHGGRIVSGGGEKPQAILPLELARAGDLAPLLSSRFLPACREAAQRGAMLLVDAKLARVAPEARGLWVHPYANWAMAEILATAIVPPSAAVVGPGCSIAPSAVLGPRVVLGARVSVGPGTVIGYAGFGWAVGSRGAVRPVPQLGGVLIEDDCSIGPLCTIDAGTLSPTRLARAVKIDAHVHVAHNVEIGEGTIIAAQCGFAGSARIGAGVLIGGQAGVADHVVVGDRARIAAKSGVIGDVPARSVVAGYPAMPRLRWLRALAKLYGGTKDER